MSAKKVTTKSLFDRRNLITYRVNAMIFTADHLTIPLPTHFFPLLVVSHDPICVRPSVRRSIGPSIGQLRFCLAGRDEPANDLFWAYKLVLTHPCFFDADAAFAISGATTPPQILLSASPLDSPRDKGCPPTPSDAAAKWQFYEISFSRAKGRHFLDAWKVFFMFKLIEGSNCFMMIVFTF